MSKVQELLQKNKQLFLTHVNSLVVLLLGFIICRYAVFGVIHGMKEWPVDLLLVGLAVHLISLLAKKQYAPWFCAVGYSLGFWLGAIFHTEKQALHGGIDDNLWEIWTVIFLACILAGIVFEIIIKWWNLLKKR